MAMTISEIWEAMNSKAESFFEWVQAYPKCGQLLAVGLLVLWLIGLLRRWRWACHWQFHGKLWMFDDCSPETRRRVQIVILSILLVIFLLTEFLAWR